jgi:hypothetical protein
VRGEGGEARRDRPDVQVVNFRHTRGLRKPSPYF